MADLGMLVAMLGMFENQVSLFPNAVFEIEDGEPVLVAQSALAELRFPRDQDGHPSESFDSGYVRERVALSTLVRNKWFTAKQEDGKLKIRLGERAKEIRKGREAQSLMV